MQITITNLQPGDVQAAATLLGLVFPLDLDFIRHDLACGLDRRNWHKAEYNFCRDFVLRVDDYIMGVAGVYNREGYPPDALAIDWMAVMPAVRRQGLGAMLMVTCVREARLARAKRLVVYADAPAVPFYERQAFKTADPRACGFEVILGATFMIRYL